MIKITGCADTVFEEAYFIVKPGSDSRSMSEKELLNEANRIIRECTAQTERRARYVKVSFPIFVSLVFTAVVGIVGFLVFIANCI